MRLVLAGVGRLARPLPERAVSQRVGDLERSRLAAAQAAERRRIETGPTPLGRRSGLRARNARPDRAHRERHAVQEIAPRDRPVHAQLAIAGLYYQGEGVPLNYEIALQWFRAAAAQGSAAAQAAIAIMYERGLGVRRDPVVAHAWLSVAADSGDDGARQRLSTFAGGLSSAERVQAEQMKHRLVAALRDGR